MTSAESVTVRYGRGFTATLWVCVVLGVLLALTGFGVGVRGSVYAVVGGLVAVLCVWIATGRTRVDPHGVKVRTVRSRSVAAGDIASLQIKTVSRQGRSRDMIVVISRDRSELTLDQVTMGTPAPDMERVRGYLRDISRVLNVPDIA
jgi:hypothetical protein